MAVETTEILDIGTATFNEDRTGQLLIFGGINLDSKNGPTQGVTSEVRCDVQQSLRALDQRQIGLFDEVDERINLINIVTEEVQVPQKVMTESGRLLIRITEIMSESELEAVFDYLLQVYDSIIIYSDYDSEGKEMMETFRIFRDHLYFLLALAKKKSPEKPSLHIELVLDGLTYAKNNGYSQLYNFQSTVTRMLKRGGYSISF